MAPNVKEPGEFLAKSREEFDAALLSDAESAINNAIERVARMRGVA